MNRHILVLTTSYPRFAGDFAGHFVQSEVERLANEGHRVTVLVAGSPRGSRIFAGRPGVEIQFLGGDALFDHPGALPRLKERPSRILAAWRPTWRLLVRGTIPKKVDRIIAHWLFPSALPWALAPGAPSAPLEVVVHGSDLELFLRLPAFLRSWSLSLLLRRRASLRFVSALQKKRLLETSLDEQHRTFVEGAAVCPSPLDFPELPDRNEARTRLGLRGDTRVGVVVGRLIASKRPDAALSAGQLVPELELFVIGEGPLSAQLQRRFPEARFLGALPRDEVLLWLRAADLVLHGSRREGAPTSLREALHLGTAIVAANCSDLDVWQNDHPNLWVVD